MTEMEEEVLESTGTSYVDLLTEVVRATRSTKKYSNKAKAIVKAVISNLDLEDMSSNVR